MIWPIFVTPRYIESLEAFLCILPIKERRILPFFFNMRFILYFSLFLVLLVYTHTHTCVLFNAYSFTHTDTFEVPTF